MSTYPPKGNRAMARLPDYITVTSDHEWQCERCEVAGTGTPDWHLASRHEEDKS